MSEQEPVVPPQGRILVADDEPHIRRILATFLEASGFVVDEVYDGAEAMARTMGVINGLEPASP